MRQTSTLEASSCQGRHSNRGICGQLNATNPALFCNCGISGQSYAKNPAFLRRDMRTMLCQKSRFLRRNMRTMLCQNPALVFWPQDLWTVLCQKYRVLTAGFTDNAGPQIPLFPLRTTIPIADSVFRQLFALDPCECKLPCHHTELFPEPQIVRLLS